MNNNHEKNIKRIIDFLDIEQINYKTNDNQTIFYLNDGKLEVRYVNSEEHKMDYSRRFGIKGIPHDYFIKISKSNYDNDIRTIWIKDWEMDESNTVKNIDGTIMDGYNRKWEVLKSYIKTATGKINNRIYARNCEIREVSNAELRPFLDTNCFYGYRSATVNLGLYSKNKVGDIEPGTLLMVYTFGYPFYGKGKYDIEIIRVATKLNHQVIGGASKLLKYFLVTYPTVTINKKLVNVDKICFYVDADHNDGRSLKTLGFDFISWTGPGFMNVDTITKTVFHRKPMIHKQIMERMAKGEVYSVANAGTIVYMIERNKYLNVT